jgi:hypothetical protein
MNSVKQSFEIDSWANNNFGSVQLFDRRRTTRLVNIAARLAENKGQSLARLFDNWYDTKAVYNLINLDIMTPDVIQDNHREVVKEDIINWKGDVLLIEDSSEFNWNGLETIEGLGPIGSGRKNDQGFILHSTLAIGIIDKAIASHTDIPVKILGLPYQQYYVRPPKREKEQKRCNGNDKLETDLWRKIIDNKILPHKNSHKLIRVCDRAADIYEVLEETKISGYDYIIRTKHDRADNDDWEIKLFETMRELPAIGLTTIERRGREGTKTRTVPLNVNWQEVSLRAPSRPGYQVGELPSLKVTVVHIWGWDAEKEELIEWFLYTSLTINDLETAIKIVKYYSQRWIIEDYHKALKSGMKAEKLQLETAHGLFAAIAIMSIVALRLIDLREVLRVNPEAKAEESGLSDLEIKVLKVYLKREIKTVKCVALAIGRLGGHLNRKSDGMPGLMTLWLGMSRLLNLVEGVKLTQVLNI